MRLLTHPAACRSGSRCCMHAPKPAAQPLAAVAVGRRPPLPPLPPAPLPRRGRSPRLAVRAASETPPDVSELLRKYGGSDGEAGRVGMGQCAHLSLLQTLLSPPATIDRLVFVSCSPCSLQEAADPAAAAWRVEWRHGQRVRPGRVADTVLSGKLQSLAGRGRIAGQVAVVLCRFLPQDPLTSSTSNQRVHCSDSGNWCPLPHCRTACRLFAILSINFLLFVGANLLHMPALASLTLNHWHPQWWQVRRAGTCKHAGGVAAGGAARLLVAWAAVRCSVAPVLELTRRHASFTVQFVTATCMHANWQHLSSNAFALLVFGRMVEEEEGALGVWLTYLLAGVGGTVASYLTSPHTHTISLGASGAVFGLFMVSRWRESSRGNGCSTGLPRCCFAVTSPAVLVASNNIHSLTTTAQVSLIGKFKPSLKRLLEFVILGQFVVQQVWQAA